MRSLSDRIADGLELFLYAFLTTYCVCGFIGAAYMLLTYGRL